MAPGVQAPAVLVGPENRAVLDLVDPEDMNRADPAVMVATVRVDLASPGVRVDPASLGARVGQEDMSPEDMSPEDLGARVDLAKRVLKARERRGREALVLNPDRAQRDPMPTALDRARPGRMPAHLDLTPAGLDRAHRHRMRAHLDPTPAHRQWAPTTRAEATRPEARIRLEATPPVATPPVATAPRVEATPRRSGEPSSRVRVACSAELSGRAHITDRERLRARAFPIEVCGYPPRMKKIARMAATAAAIAGFGLVGLGAATDAQAQPGPFPQWCPGEFWDPGWGDNWDNGGCHDNFRAGGPGWDNRGGPGWDNRGGPGGPGWDHGGPGGPGWDHGGPGGPGWDNHGGPGGDNHGGPGGDNHGPGGPGGHR